MKLTVTILLFLLSSVLLKSSVFAQTISKEELIFLTSAWKGERYVDGRPKVSDNLLQRAKHIMVDDAWTVLRNEGYLSQFEGGWKTINNIPMTGRAVTAMYLPSRPDVEKNIKERGARQGRKGDTNSWPIRDHLVKYWSYLKSSTHLHACELFLTNKRGVFIKKS